MGKRNVTRSTAAEHEVQLRVTSPFIHRGARRLVGELINCTADEAQGALFHGWAVLLVNGEEHGRHQRRDMRAKNS